MDRWGLHMNVRSHMIHGGRRRHLGLNVNGVSVLNALYLLSSFLCFSLFLLIAAFFAGSQMFDPAQRIQRWEDQ